MQRSSVMLRFMKQRSRSQIPWPVFAVTVAAAFMVVARPLDRERGRSRRSGDSFPEVSTATLSWVLAAYSVVFGALLLGAGRIADRSGRRRIFLLGLLIFTAGSLLCGVAPSAWLLIGGRVVQAVGAALLMPASLALLLTATPAGGPGAGGGDVGRHLRAGGRHRAVARFGADRRRRVAVGVLRQPARRPRRRVRHPAGGAGVDHRRTGPRPRRGGHALGCGGGRSRWPSPRAATGAGRAPASSALRARRRARPARRPPFHPPRGAGHRPRGVPVADRGPGQRGDVPLLGRLLRDAAGQRPVPHLGVGLLDARRRAWPSRRGRCSSPRSAARADGSRHGSATGRCSSPAA